jgi:K+-sensing histidine kinase KdpD
MMLDDDLRALVHDLRTPLYVVAGYARLLLDRDRGLGQPERAIVACIERQVQALAGRIPELLADARPAAEALPAGLRPAGRASGRRRRRARA